MNSCPRLDGGRLALGFLLAPAVAPISAMLITYAVTKEHSGDCLFGGITLVMTFFGFPLSYFSALVLGFPYVCVMHKKEHLNFWTIMAGGLALWAGLCAFMYVAPSKDLRVLRYAIAPLSLVGILLEAVFFYCVALWRPNRLSS
jgi:H+/gluconate symporter-like permease